ncbi:hypothetical protein MAM1_0045c03110 [Mucor ambiguus]|uniref:Uncharacterized protein n=1 Tax=Mucor ambiguus TaxID=91626 RepID=A0A0C9LTD5_9FUNG|nr:hypothetical protein MAM1_0045c03110 [Mucor ambiguus]
MKNSIRTLLGLKKKSTRKQNVNALDQVYSPSSSVSSFSSDASSDSSQPQTPTSMSMQDNRGIFRTLEPVWYFSSKLIPNQQSHQQQEWIRFDDQSQFSLENALQSKPECVLSQSQLGPCTVLFKPLPLKSATTKTRHSMMIMSSQHTSMPSLRPSPLNAATGSGLTLELNKTVRRTISPVWWYEQDSADGSKGMCRFDYRNQVRLEALSEGRTRLVLTDDAFNVPFTVVLEAPKQRELKEEVRGFLYLEPVSTAFQLAYNATLNGGQKMEQFQVEDPNYYDEEDVSLSRRFSI